MDIPEQPGFQMCHVFPDAGLWEAKCIQEMVTMACPHGVAGPYWMPRVRMDQVGLKAHAVTQPQL